MRQQMIGLGMAFVLAAGAAPANAQDAKAAEILAAARKAIGNSKLEPLKALSVQASVQRNVGSMQMQSESRAAPRAARQVRQDGRLQRPDEHDDVHGLQR